MPETKTTEPKILLFDIETMPNLGWAWEQWDQNVIGVEIPWFMLSFAYKWLGDKSAPTVVALPDFKGYKKDMYNDEKLTRALYELFEEADAVIAHNGDKFDIRKANARFILHGLTPPAPYKSIDTLKIARRHFKFYGNRLDDLAVYFGVGQKLKNPGFPMWRDSGYLGKKDAWDMMRKYNAHDVVLLEDVYNYMRPWYVGHPNYNLYAGTMDKCPHCGGGKLQKRGYHYTRVAKHQRYQCTTCGAWSHAPGKEGKNVIR